MKVSWINSAAELRLYFPGLSWVIITSFLPREFSVVLLFWLTESDQSKESNNKQPFRPYLSVLTSSLVIGMVVPEPQTRVYRSINWRCIELFDYVL